MLKRCCLIVLLVLATLPCFAAEPMRYIYPPPESGADQRMNYYWDLLKAALEITIPKYGPYELRTAPDTMNADRATALLAESRDITLLARTTSLEREKVLLPLLIPLDKGLTGYRMFLIRAETQEQLDKVKTLDDLKAFRMGQGEHWVDTNILRVAGFKVETGTNYQGLFEMLSAGRFELFSRGVNEIGKEFEKGHAANRDLAIEKRLMLYYPLPRYFFFTRSPEGERLSRRVEEGIMMMRRNGDFEKRYRAFKKEILAGLNVSGRKLFRIENPLLSAETPLHKRELWDKLEAELKPARP